MAEATVAASFTRGLLEFATARGADPDALLRRSGLVRAALDDPDARVAFDRYVALMRASQALTGDPALALHFAEAVSNSKLSVVGLLGEASATLLDAFEQVRRYGRLVTDLGEDRFSMVEVAGQLWSVDGRSNPNAFPELTETTFAYMVCGARVAGPTDWLKAVHVTHPAPSYAAEYKRVFGAPVTFGARWNALAIDRSFLTRPVAAPPRYVFGVLSRHADGLLAALDAAGTVRARVEALLLPTLHTGRASADAVARQVGVSRPTLYRRLKAEGVTFEQVLDALRRRLALQYLDGGRTSVAEVAYLVGFSDPAAFSRAFKRWTGRSPRTARAAAGSA